MPNVVPYGFLRCTCDDPPRLTYINARMLEYLGVTQAYQSWKEVLKENIYVIIPTEERDRFQQYLNQALQSDHPINIEHNLLGNGGNRVPLMGWISVQKSQNGTKEFAILYMRPEYKHTEKIADLENSYSHALKSAYGLIFELNLDASTIDCIHGRETSEIGAIADIQMSIESAKKYWLNNYIHPDDRPMMTQYLDHVTAVPPEWDGLSALQAEFRINWVDGITHRFLAVAVKVDNARIFLCCRDITRQKYAGFHEQESHLYEKMREWMDIFSTSNPARLGMLIFEQTPLGRAVLYASPPIRRYLTQGTDAIPPYLELGGMSDEEFQQLLEAKRFSYTLDVDGHQHQLQITTRHYTQDDRLLYIMWVYEKDAPQAQEMINEPPLEPAPESAPEPAKPEIFARTFGHFDLFVDGKPVTFSSAKEKELMALLIDRNGGTISTTEAVSYLWEDEAADERVCNRYRKLAMSLKKTLESYGIDNILITQKGVRSVDVTALQCDYYEYLAGNEKFIKMFHNAYMSDYSWSEETLARLWIEPDNDE
jgi:hypothetical protein